MNKLEFEIWFKKTKKRIAKILANKGVIRDCYLNKTWDDFLTRMRSLSLAFRGRAEDLEILIEKMKNIDKYLDLIEADEEFRIKETTIFCKDGRGHRNLDKFLQKAA